MSIVVLFKSTFLLSSLIVFWGYSQPMLKAFNHPINPQNNLLVAQNSTPVAVELQEILPKIKEQTQLPILLPSKLLITGTDRKIYVEGKGTNNSYKITLAFEPNCTGNACSIGYISAEKGGKPLEDEFSRELSLVQNIKGYFRPLTCAASCAPPILGWEYKGVFYRMAFKGVGQSPEIEGDTLAKMANSAIEAGAR
ncbi:MAG: hypothetical protein F6K22_22825 [Okeania sp. SIO2F4]|uniref:hypothetical protein n=1 Tax=Okeania sp. SIO2F4 TaxID=2607790 RepID=UPI00142C41A3|nr:hypothetical protein [Okeania sp. SIO2F4]NES05401.1 hypothetical protein [Okeania sp. SIO2F4]